jgi:hypothetical protein
MRIWCITISIVLVLHCFKDDNQPLVCLMEKGSKGINDASQRRGDKLLTESGQYVHSKCREVYINEFNINKAATKKVSI